MNTGSTQTSGTAYTRTSCHKTFIPPYTLTFPVLGPGTQWPKYKLSGGEPTHDRDGKFVYI